VSPRIYIIVGFLGLQACTSRGVDCESPEFRAYSAVLEASIGARSADEYFTVWRTPLNACEAESRRALFIEAFFDGYRVRSTFDGDPSMELRLMRAGARAGEEYRRANPDSAVATYASFGYTAVTVKGMWTTGFETSRFIPAEGYPGEQWWLDLLPELERTLPVEFVPEEGQVVQIAGYVSGLGRHGHLGAYQRQMYVRELNVVESAQQSVAADRREDAAPAAR
jgi:hypothetical protein